MKKTLTAVDREALVKKFIEIELVCPESDFLIVKETLSRIGIASRRDGKNYLAQTCHILHKKNKYYLVHFKELFMLDNRLKKKMTAQDEARTRCIAKLLEDWELVKIVSPFDRNEKFNLKKLKLTVVPYKEKNNWILSPKYMIGKVKKNAISSNRTERYERYENVDDMDDIEFSE
ncbi:MAG: translational repressor RegA [Patescibacteria group bacterium]|nr:translational repressor RegA [Patescibacteria group bacterium]